MIIEGIIIAACAIGTTICIIALLVTAFGDI